MSSRPSSGSMVYWRFKSQRGNWSFGYCTYTRGYDLVRMGRWNGDTMGGSVVSVSEIEWRDFHGTC